MLDPRAQEYELFNHALCCVRRVQAHLGSFDRRPGAPSTSQELVGTLNHIASVCQARPVAEKITLSGRVARMTDPLWWSKILRRELLRENEAFIHASGAVRRKGQVYVSDFGVERKAARAKQNRVTLERLEVVNEDGRALNLAEVADTSISNPKLRRSELMVRCRGFEETAKFTGDEAIFLTLTTPSRFHRFNANGQTNPNWEGQTPKDSQNYLCELWTKIRAKWNRQGFTPYGFRVAEPHHDGCVHWHILLFVPPAQVGWFKPSSLLAGRADHGAGVVGIAGEYALKDSPSEAGAIKHRFTVKKIDVSKGSATGYIAKYICKNIDGTKDTGEEMGLDFASGKKASEASKRVRSWASIWGFRQFQQIGGPSVTVWRELRRLGKNKPVRNELFEGPRAAADRSLWALFWVLQGGPESPRKQLLKPMWISDSTGKYGDLVKRVIGVQDGALVQSMVTRRHTWTVQRTGLAEVNRSETERKDTRRIQKNVDAFLSAAGVSSLSNFERNGEAMQPCAWIF
jgi:hypothetical protein